MGKHFLLWMVWVGLGNAAVAQKLYRTPSGGKYHLANCRTVQNVSYLVTLADAAKLGLQPCKICKPPVSGVLYSSAPSKAAGASTITYQCLGITKKGTRCKHRTHIANGYCFQHRP